MVEVKLLLLPPTLQFSSTAPRLGNFGRTAIAPDQTSHPRRLLSFTPWELLWRNRYPGSLVVANQVARLFCHIRGKMLGGGESLLQKCSLSLHAEPGFKVQVLEDAPCSQSGRDMHCEVNADPSLDGWNEMCLCTMEGTHFETLARYINTT